MVRYVACTGSNVAATEVVVVWKGGVPELDMELASRVGCEYALLGRATEALDVDGSVVVAMTALFSRLVLVVEETLDTGRHEAASGGHDLTNSVLVIVVVVTSAATLLLKLGKVMGDDDVVVTAPTELVVVVVERKGSTEGA